MRIRSGYSNELPSKYQEVEYIASSGTQYINTGYIAKVNNVKLELDMAWTGSSLGAFESFMGFMYSTSTVNPRMALHKYSSVLMFGANATTTSGVAPVKNERFVYRGDFTSGAQKLYKNGTQIATNSNTYDFSTNTCPVYIFARYCPNGMNYSTMRVYRAKIYEGTTLKMDFIPCYRKLDSAIGLYDKVTKQFYVNSGTGTFTKGKDIYGNYKIAYKNLSQSIIVCSPTINLLPSTYQQVEYIQSSGAQRIKLNITPTSKYKIEEVFEITDRTVTSCIWCARGATTQTTSLTAFNIANGNLRCDFNSSQTNVQALNVNQKYNLTLDSNKWYLDGVLKVTSATTTFTAGGALELFASYVNGQDNSLANYAKLKMYSFKVWNANRSLVGNFVPCYRKSDGVIGMYDTVSKTFFINNGSGTFIKGPNIR